MKKWFKIVLVIEIQVVLVLLAIVVFKTYSLENKLYNTNKFIHKALIDGRIKKLNTIDSHDIVIGDAEACVTMILYSRYDCPACNDFFSGNYELIKNEFIDNGKLKLVVRYLVHPSKKETLFAAKYSYRAHSLDRFDTYIKEVYNKYPKFDTVEIYNFIQKIEGRDNSLINFIEDKSVNKRILRSSNEYRNAEILSTPTIYINDQRLVGNRDFNKLKRVILKEMENTLCN